MDKPNIKALIAAILVAPHLQFPASDAEGALAKQRRALANKDLIEESLDLAEVILHKSE